LFWYLFLRKGKAMTEIELLERLAEHKTLGTAPREELAWLATHGTVRTLSVGEFLSTKEVDVEGLYILLSGRVTHFVDRGAGPVKVIEWRGGDVTGVLPYSRLVKPPGNSIAEEPTEILSLHRSLLRDLTTECYEITSILVRVMLDRARLFTSSDLLNEKMISLGKLSAGLAHELNNPASAIERAAAQFDDHLDAAGAATLALSASQLTDAQLEAVRAIHASCVTGQASEILSPLDQSAREDAFADWLCAHGLDIGCAYPLAGTDVSLEALNRLAAAVNGPILITALRWVAAECGLRSLATGMQGSAMRIAGLVAAVKGFTHMGQPMVAEAVDLKSGLNDTLKVLGAKAREKEVTVVIDLEARLPKVHGFAGELNQIWGNLVENAIDAAPQGGRIEVLAKTEGERVVVRIIDNGCGIPAQICQRVFDPFFTTKPTGQGIGLGLDIARRLVRHNDGVIEFESQPGRTEFWVALPIAV
jgi:signal transduction histidine kinase